MPSRRVVAAWGKLPLVWGIRRTAVLLCCWLSPLDAGGGDGDESLKAIRCEFHQ
jgi:hypothetical protein